MSKIYKNNVKLSFNKKNSSFKPQKSNLGD